MRLLDAYVQHRIERRLGLIAAAWYVDDRIPEDRLGIVSNGDLTVVQNLGGREGSNQEPR